MEKYKNSIRENLLSSDMKNELTTYRDIIPLKVKIRSKTWLFVWRVLVRPFSFNGFNRYRLFIYRIFGLKHGRGVIIHSSARILAPWNISVQDYSTIGPYVKCDYGCISIGSKVTISQGSSLYSGSHDISTTNLTYINSSIQIKDFVWIAADCTVGPGVTIGEGSIAGARAVVFSDLEDYCVYIGNPARFLKRRQIVKDF